MPRDWRRSTRCIDGKCVEVAEDDDHVLVRDSKQGVAGDVLNFTRQEWADFIAGVKAGEFDIP